jgi:hypothetical protein
MWNGECWGSFVPLERDSTVQGALPVLRDLVERLQGLDEVVCVAFAHVFHSEIIDYEGEGHRAADVLPQAGGVRHLEVAGGDKTLLEELVGQGSRLGEAIDCLADFDVHEAILRAAGKVVLVNDVLGELVQGHLHVLETIKRGPKELGCREVSSACGQFAWVFDEVPSCSDAHTVGIGLLGTVVHNDAGVGYLAVAWDVLDLVVGHDKKYHA